MLIKNSAENRADSFLTKIFPCNSSRHCASVLGIVNKKKVFREIIICNFVCFIVASDTSVFVFGFCN